MKPIRFLMVLLICGMLCGCSAADAGGEAGQPQSAEFLAMDTIMKLTVYGQPPEAGNKTLQKAKAEIEGLERLLSVTDENSDIYRANHGQGKEITLSEPTRELTAEALRLCGETEGALDVTVYPIVRAWGFTTGEYRVPGDPEIKSLLERVDYSKVSLEGSGLTLPEGVEIDLGAVAKGYTGDRLMDLFTEAGVSSAIVELGGNVQALGAKPDGSPWRIALQDPEGGYAGVLEIVNQAAITSGGYQRYFEEDGERYIHIIDPAAGYPADSGLASVTIVADSGVRADGLSTALYVMGREKAEEFWRRRQDFDFIMLTDEGTAVITEGLEDTFQLYGAWADRPLEVIRRAPD